VSLCLYAAAETEGFDLVGQIAPYSVAEALALIPKLAAQLLARLQHGRSSLSAQAASMFADREAALQQLLQSDLPYELQQYLDSMQAAEATTGKQGPQHPSGQHPYADAAVADLLGLDDDDWFDQLTAPAAAPAAQQSQVEFMPMELQTDGDLAAAAAAAAQLAPDLHIAQHSEEESQGQADDNEPYDLLFGAASASIVGGGLQDWVDVVPDAAGVDGDAAAESEAVAAADWAGDAGDDDAGDDAYQLLFAGEADDTVSLDSGSWQSGGHGQAVSDPLVAPDNTVAGLATDLAAGDPSWPDSLQDAPPHSSTTLFAAVPGVDTHAPADPASVVAATEISAAASDSGSAADASEPFDLEAFFVYSLSVQDRAKLEAPATKAAKSSSLALPERLRAAVRQALGLLEALVAATASSSSTVSNSGKAAQGDAASVQLLHKLQSIWQQLDAPALNTADPLFLFRDGPVTTAAKQGCVLLLEDFNRFDDPPSIVLYAYSWCCPVQACSMSNGQHLASLGIQPLSFNTRKSMPSIISSPLSNP